MKIVRSGWAEVIATTFGRTRGNHGIVQSVPQANIRYMSTQKWTAFRGSAVAEFVTPSSWAYPQASPNGGVEASFLRLPKGYSEGSRF